VTHTPAVSTADLAATTNAWAGVLGVSTNLWGGTRPDRDFNAAHDKPVPGRSTHTRDK
jgi:hypothetical protein